MSIRKDYGVYCIAEIISDRPMEFQLFKIGVTSNLQKRLSSLQVGNPMRLAPIMVDWFWSAADAYSVERRIHDYMADFAKNGEWFDFRDGAGACPFEAMSVCASHLNYHPANDSYYDHLEPDYEAVLLSRPIRSPELLRIRRTVQ